MFIKFFIGTSASDVIKESEMSDVMLKCDYSYYARKSDDVDILWFQEDHLVLPNKTKKIHDVVMYFLCNIHDHNLKRFFEIF